MSTLTYGVTTDGGDYHGVGYILPEMHNTSIQAINSYGHCV